MIFTIDWLFIAGYTSSLLAVVAPAAEHAESTPGLDMQIALIAGGASLAGALVGALIPAAVTYFQNRGNREDERGFLAVQVAASLYTFASGCVDVMYDNGEPDEQGRDCIVVGSPNFSTMSLGVNWRSISVELLDRIFAIPTAQRIVNERLGWEAQNDFEYPILDRQIAYSKLGIKALHIAHDLRRSAGLPPDPDGVIDLMTQLKERLPELEKKEAEAQRWRNAPLSVSPVPDPTEPTQ